MQTKFDIELLRKAIEKPLERRYLPLVMVYGREQWLNDEVLQNMFAFTEKELETALQNNDGIIGKKGGYFCIVNEVKP